jgi:hypothetical protein
VVQSVHRLRFCVCGKIGQFLCACHCVDPSEGSRGAVEVGTAVQSSLWTATLVLLTFSCAASTQGCPLYQEFLIPGILYSRSQQSTPTTAPPC